MVFSAGLQGPLAPEGISKLEKNSQRVIKQNFSKDF